ncbi:uncharacterized protein LOC5510908 isoform X2 [Nematostella vectensis]|uniref:uncharacterized protein LOC5510908 isoform X2 n=1 Tax=Nematostella vectensis TaxID=45351 RepID=UPI00138F9F88|nr:uncharacterized protein LOC5510908 isoform X2 [Nematostella vectensis]
MLSKMTFLLALILMVATSAKGYESIQDKEVPPNERLSSCDIQIEKIGCYNDTGKLPRPLPELLLNDRNPESVENDGHIFDWDKPDASMQSLVCRCAKRALDRGYSHFGLQFYGECWSGKNAGSTFKTDGPSRTCLGRSLKACDAGSDFPCTGRDFSNFVYRIRQTGPAMTAKPPAGPCIDEEPTLCAHYADNGLCTQSFPLVLKRCRKSCKLCTK